MITKSLLNHSTIASHLIPEQKDMHTKIGSVFLTFSQTSVGF